MPRQHLVGSADREAALGEVQDAVDHAEHGVHIVGDEDDGCAVVAPTRVDELAHLALVVQVEAHERLIAQQQHRVVGERLGDPQALLLAA